MTFCRYTHLLDSHKPLEKEKHMLIGIDKRGSINLPVEVRKEFGLEIGSYLDLSIESGGSIVLHPVSIYHNIKVSEAGSKKLHEGRKCGTGKIPAWLVKDMKNVEPDTK
jgi:AbrB family looped-hinge helix DNA binding protein